MHVCIESWNSEALPEILVMGLVVEEKYATDSCIGL
jgi:hypothetical protein